MRQVWNSLNARLLKWVKWEKYYGKKKSIRYLKAIFKEKPVLFAHWRLVHPGEIPMRDLEGNALDSLSIKRVENLIERNKKIMQTVF